MAGGLGTRLDSPHEKPLHPIGGVPMVDRVLSALDASSVETVFAAVSPNAPETRAHLDRSDSVRTIETPGEGYVADLVSALDRDAVDEPVLTVAADLPLLAPTVVDRVCDRYSNAAGRTTNPPSMTVCVPASLKRRLGVSVDSRLDGDPHLAPTGVNIVGTETAMTQVSYDPRLAVNVNRPGDVDRAIELLETIDSDRGDRPCV